MELFACVYVHVSPSFHAIAASSEGVQDMNTAFMMILQFHCTGMCVHVRVCG